MGSMSAGEVPRRPGVPIGQRPTSTGDSNPAGSGYRTPPNIGPGTPPPSTGLPPVTTRRSQPPKAPQRALPRDAHIDVLCDGTWRQGLLLEQTRAHPNDVWRLHVVYLAPTPDGGITLTEAWVSPSQARLRTTP